MKKSKFIKAIILGICVSILSAGVVFAESGGGEDGQMTKQEPALMSTTESSPDSSVSSTEIYQPEEDAKVLERQEEIDHYLFGDQQEDIVKKGITVTHTYALDGYVEIGITPYNQANADIIYAALGEDMIKVVEGIQAQTMEISTYNSNIAESGIVENDIVTTDAADDKSLTDIPEKDIVVSDKVESDIVATNIAENETVTTNIADNNIEKNSLWTIFAYIAGTLVLIVGIVIGSRRLKATKK